MKRLVALVIAAALSLQLAQAADMVRPVYKAAPGPLAPTYSWSGFYFGGHAGWGWAHNRFRDVVSGTDSADFTADGGFVGGQVGYNWQSGAWVFGIEGEGSFAQIRKGVPGGFCGGFQNFGCFPPRAPASRISGVRHSVASAAAFRTLAASGSLARASNRWRC